MDSALKILISDCKPKQQVSPTIDIIINGSFMFNNLNKNLTIIIKINKIIIEQKINPSSSPATAKIKSVFASGIFSFKTPWPGPLPNKPPL